MRLMVAYRKRGSPFYTHHFSIEASSWRSFYRQARRDRQTSVYAVVRRNGEYREILS